MNTKTNLELTTEQVEGLQRVFERVSDALRELVEKMLAVFERMRDVFVKTLEFAKDNLARAILYVKLIHYLPHWLAAPIANCLPRAWLTVL